MDADQHVQQVDGFRAQFFDKATSRAIGGIHADRVGDDSRDY